MAARNEGGFTLLELLAALSVLAVLMALMFGGLRFGARVWETGDTALRDLSALQTATGFLRRQIAQAVPPNPALDDDPGHQAKTMGFRGAPDALRFVGPRPSQLLPGGLYEMVLGLEEKVGRNGPAGRLSVWWRPLGPLASAGDLAMNEDERTRQIVLLEGVADIRLRYFGIGDSTDEPPQWRDRWDNAMTLPSLVSVRVAFLPGDRRAWPELIVAPVVAPPF